MKNKHIIALILSVVIGASALAPIRGIRANASEVGTDTSESDILYEIGSETGKTGTEAVETGSSDLEGAANELESGHGVCEDMSITSEEVGSAAESTSIDLGQELNQPQSESYTAAKGGIAALTHALAVSLSGRVRVNSISPGWTRAGRGQKAAWPLLPH